MEKDILQNHFETVYKDFKDYESYITSNIEELNKQRESFKDRVVSGKDNEDSLISALFDLSIKPIQSDEDLRILRDRLINVYDSYKIALDFPTEIINEISKLKRPYQAYRIDNGNQVVIDKDKNDKFRQEVRKKHSEYLKALKSE